MEEMRVGVIGAGSHAQAHFQMIDAEPAMRLIGVAELDQDRMRKAKVDYGPEVVTRDYRSSWTAFTAAYTLRWRSNPEWTLLKQRKCLRLQKAVKRK